MECWTAHCTPNRTGGHPLWVEQARRLQVNRSDGTSELESGPEHQSLRSKDVRDDQVSVGNDREVGRQSDELLSLRRNCLLQTLKHSMQILEFVKSKGIEVKFHGRTKNEASHYCGQCEVSWNGDIKTSPNTTELITRFVTFIRRLKCSTFSSSASKKSVTWSIAWAALESSRRRFKASSVSRSTKSTSSCRSTTPLCCTDRPLNQCSCHRLRLLPSPSCNSNKSRPYHNSLATL